MSKYTARTYLRLCVLLGVIVVSLNVASAAPSTVPHLGYGFNVAALDTSRLTTMGFNWIKIFDVPPGNLPQAVLMRVEANSTLSTAAVLEDIDNKLNYLSANSLSVAAWEIGNEPNLDASYGWAAAPNAADYAQMLCAAYAKLKSRAPKAIVVSAGLAPTGRVTGNWNGHPGHNGLYQDEREYLKEFLAAGGGACLDAVGYHPYGYSADYNAAPDVASNDPTQNCANGFCFRGAEKIYEIMQAYGLGDKQMWATEFGWIRIPPDQCLNDWTWQGRQWQIVTDQKQADNLVGAFQYADANWPWMGPMFIFNLNFNEPGLHPECEQMRYYAVQGLAAESALTAMPKNPADLPRRLTIGTQAINVMIAQSWQPITQTVKFPVTNCCAQSLVYSITLEPGSTVVPDIFNGTNSIAAFGQRNVHVHIGSFNRTPGVYTSTLTFTVTPASLGGLPQSIPLQLLVVEQVYQAYLPAVMR